MQTEDKIFVAPNTELAAVTMADMAPGSFDSLMRSLGISDPSRLLSSRPFWGSCAPAPGTTPKRVSKVTDI
jgi:hypothetical protein